MVCWEEHQHLARPPNVVAMLYNGVLPYVVRAVKNNCEADGSEMFLPAVEVQIKVSVSTFGRANHLSLAETIYWSMENNVCNKSIPGCHACRVMQQTALLQIFFAEYLVTPENIVLTYIPAFISETQRSCCLSTPLPQWHLYWNRPTGQKSSSLFVTPDDVEVRKIRVKYLNLSASMLRNMSSLLPWSCSNILFNASIQKSNLEWMALPSKGNFWEVPHFIYRTNQRWSLRFAKQYVSVTLFIGSCSLVLSY